MKKSDEELQPKIEDVKYLPIHNVDVKDAQCCTVARTVKTMTEVKMLLSQFACVQFIEGADLWYNDHSVNTATEPKLLIKLSRHLGENDMMTIITLTAGEIALLRNWLITRMFHCEKEREERSEKFNADTYIGQKHLLLDLRELLMGEIIYSNK